MLSCWYQRARLYVRANRAYLKSFFKTYGELELALLRHIVPRRVSIDVGANKGLYVFFLRKFSTKVIAFEPNETLFEPLSRTRYPNVQYVCAASASTSGASTFFVPKKDGVLKRNVGSLKASSEYADREEITVQKQRIDDVARGLDIGFIKIDTEGTELDVVLGAMEIVRSCRPVLFIEIHDKVSKESRELFDIVKSLNYVAAEYYDRLLVIKKDISSIRTRNIIFFPLS